jgi:glycine cleavage system H protein
VEGDIAYVGITDYAQHELGEIVFVEVETVGENLQSGEVFGTVEAVKTVSELFMPVDGEVLEVNPELEKSPEIANDKPYAEGWLVKVSVANLAQVDNLLSADEYAALIG